MHNTHTRVRTQTHTRTQAQTHNTTYIMTHESRCCRQQPRLYAMALHFQVREAGRQPKLTTYIFHPKVPADVHNVTLLAHNLVAASSVFCSSLMHVHAWTSQLWSRLAAGFAARRARPGTPVHCAEQVLVEVLAAPLNADSGAGGVGMTQFTD